MCSSNMKVGSQETSLAKSVSEDQRDDGHKLNKNVEGRTTRVLKRITNGVSDDGSGMFVGSLADGAVVLVSEDSRLDVLLGVVPSSSRVTHRDGQLDSGKKGSWKEAGNH